MKDFDGVLLASGGMDSSVLAYDLEKKGLDLIVLFLDYGQHCVDKEFETLKRVVPIKYAENIRRIDISSIYKDSNSRMIREANLWQDKVVADDLYLPYRNILFLSIASAYAQNLGIKDIFCAFINSNHAKEIDCSMDFFNKVENLLEEYGSIRVHMPYRELSKTDVAKLGLELQAPIAYTYSCQVSSTTPCGACPNCVDRLTAMNSIVFGES